MHLELERIVPTGSTRLPFVWAVGEDYHTFEDGVQHCAELIADGAVVDEGCVTHVIFNV